MTSADASQVYVINVIPRHVLDRALRRYAPKCVLARLAHIGGVRRGTAAWRRHASATRVAHTCCPAATRVPACPVATRVPALQAALQRRRDGDAHLAQAQGVL